MLSDDETPPKLTRSCLRVARIVFRGDRVQILPLYAPTPLFIVNAATGGFGGSAGWLATMGVMTLTLASCSLLL